MANTGWLRQCRDLLCIAAAITVAVCSVALSVHAAIVALEKSQEDGGLLAIPVIVESGKDDEATGMQFDFTFDPEAYDVLDVETGETASAAMKNVMFSRLENGRVRVVVAGLNTDAIPDGIVATLVLEPLTDEKTAQNFDLKSIIIAGPLGEPVNVNYVNRGLAPTTTPQSKQLKSQEPEVAQSGEARTLRERETPAPARRRDAKGRIVGGNETRQAAKPSAIRNTDENPTRTGRRSSVRRGQRNSTGKTQGAEARTAIASNKTKDERSRDMGTATHSGSGVIRTDSAVPQHQWQVALGTPMHIEDLDEVSELSADMLGQRGDVAKTAKKNRLRITALLAGSAAVLLVLCARRFLLRRRVGQ